MNRAVAVLLLLGLLIYYFYQKKRSSAAAQISCGGCQMPTACNITSDPTTWPSGDRFWLVAHAIAFAEGADKAGSNPDRLNNPGDISDGAAEFGFEVHSLSKVTHFPDKQTGWKWLYDKIKNAYDGSSSVYFPTDTWSQIAQKWAGDWKNWVTNVTNTLNVSTDSTLADYING